MQKDSETAENNRLSVALGTTLFCLLDSYFQAQIHELQMCKGAVALCTSRTHMNTWGS